MVNENYTTQDQLGASRLWRHAPCPPGMEEEANKIYAVRFTSKSNIRGIGPGTFLYGKRDSSAELKSGDLVVYVDSNSMAQLRRLKITKKQVILYRLATSKDTLTFPIEGKGALHLDRIVYVWTWGTGPGFSPNKKTIKLVRQQKEA